MSTKIIRQEYKYFVSNDEIIFLRSVLPKLMDSDPNIGKTRANYTVTSLYFDSHLKDALDDKQSGIGYREKFRIRTYDSSNSVIKFELKQRADVAINKITETITKEQTKSILQGSYDCLKEKDSKFLNETYIKFKTRGFKPSVIVEYDREAYMLPYGNIRITFDTNLRTYNNHKNILELHSAKTPIFLEGSQILEVKFSMPLPDHITSVLSKITATRCAISKFVFAQKYIDASPWRDKIAIPY
jgi:hypothetical protein